MRILLVEDDAMLAAAVVRSLTDHHYVVDVVEDGQLGWDYAQDGRYDLILMDVGLPKLDGVSLCQSLRRQGSTVPILLMTARQASGDRIQGLDAGADDYLVKPFDLGELQARVRALLRRQDALRSPILQVGVLQLNPSTCDVTYGGKPLVLTPKEYSLLELFLRHPLRVFSRGDMIDHLWSFDDPPQEESVKSHIKGLRQKLKQAGAVDWIENVYGLGYRLKPGVGNPSPEPGTTATGEQAFNQALEQVWVQHQDLMTERLTVLHQAALERATLSSSLRQAATQAAHKLAGVLGMFGRDDGTEAARTLEALLGTTVPLTLEQQQTLVLLVQQLSQICQVPLPPLNLVELAPLSTLALKVLAVDDDPMILAALRSLLQPWGVQLTTLSDPHQFWETLPTVAPDLLILDVEMPGLSGVDLCQAVRVDPTWQGIPVVFLTAHQEPQTVQQVFAAGADDYVIKPILGPELLTRIINRLDRIRLLQRFSTRDALTGLLNQPQASLELTRRLQTGDPLTLVLLSTPDLRQMHREHGHTLGNQVLQQWGRSLPSQFPQSALLSYWGNGEFVVGLAGEDPLDLEAVEQAIAQPMVLPDGTVLQTRCRGAIAQAPTDGQTVQSLYRIASLRLDSKRL